MAKTVRAGAFAPAGPAPRAAYTWNRGYAGTSTLGRATARPGECPNGNERCGRKTPMWRARGMVLVKGSPGMLPLAYCTGWCEQFGRALADVRSLRPREERRAAS